MLKDFMKLLFSRCPLTAKNHEPNSCKMEGMSMEVVNHFIEVPSTGMYQNYFSLVTILSNRW